MFILDIVILQGGLLFYTLKVTLKMYLKQQQFLRQGSRRVLDYDPAMDPDGPVDAAV